MGFAFIFSLFCQSPFISVPSPSKSSQEKCESTFIKTLSQMWQLDEIFISRDTLLNLSGLFDSVRRNLGVKERDCLQESACRQHWSILKNFNDTKRCYRIVMRESILASLFILECAHPLNFIIFEISKIES